MDSSSFFRAATTSHLDYTFNFTEFDICNFYLLYFGNGFEQPFWTKNLFCCYTNKEGNSGSAATKFKLAVEIANEVTDRDHIVEGVQGNNGKMLGSMINSLIMKGVLCGNNRKGGAEED